MRWRFPCPVRLVAGQDKLLKARSATFQALSGIVRAAPTPVLSPTDPGVPAFRNRTLTTREYEKNPVTAPVHGVQTATRALSFKQHGHEHS